MKKIFLLIMLCLPFSMAIAQDPAQKSKVRFGVKGGANASTVAVSLSEDASGAYTKYDSDYKYRVGFNLGILCEVSLTKVVSLQPELLLSLKGMRNESYIDVSRVPTSGYSTVKVHEISHFSLYYFEIPLYVKAGFALGKSGSLKLGLGPYLAYGVDGKMKFEATFVDYGGYASGMKNIFVNDEMKVDKDKEMSDLLKLQQISWVGVTLYNMEPYFTKSIKRFDAGISAIIEYELNMGLFASIGYEWGMVNTMNNPGDSWGGEVSGKMYNRTASVSFGYKLPIRRHVPK